MFTSGRPAFALRRCWKIYNGFAPTLLLQLLYWVTDSGKDIAIAQYVFMGVYVSMMMLVLSIYRHAGSKTMPLWSILLVCASRR